jgi:hypothetical protein
MLTCSYQMLFLPMCSFNVWGDYIGIDPARLQWRSS